MIWTDLRAKLLQELLGAMRIIKYFCYEIPYLNRIGSIRYNELRGISKILIIRAAKSVHSLFYLDSTDLYSVSLLHSRFQQ
jgi:hypothetical protein